MIFPDYRLFTRNQKIEAKGISRKDAKDAKKTFIF